MALIDIFKNRKIVIATKHEKEKVIAPILKKELGVDALVPENFDSDRFGTFTGEIKRSGTQLEAARKKALYAMELTGLDLAIASEGSFDKSELTPYLSSNLELVLLIDKKNGYEIRGHYENLKTNVFGDYVRSVDEALSFAKKINFPEHGIILRKNKSRKIGIEKGIHSEEMLIKAVKNALAKPFSRRVFLEADLRAHRNPTRMQAIKKATKDLIKNIRSECPRCKSPGFTPVDIEKGLPCVACGTPTEIPIYEIYSCQKCQYNEKVQAKDFNKKAGAEHCHHCNP